MLSKDTVQDRELLAKRMNILGNLETYLLNKRNLRASLRVCWISKE
jgi:hypothetical protein